MKRVALLSVHSCPLAALGGKETGGMNVYVRELSRELGRLGWAADVFTRSQNPHICSKINLGKNVRVVHLKAGPEEPVAKNELLRFLPEFTANIVRFAEQNGLAYDLVHSHYWLSGWVGGRLQARWSVPLVHMFHTLGMLKNTVQRRKEDRESAPRLRVEREIMGFADRLVASSPWEQEQMIRHYGTPADKIEVIPCGVDLNLFRPMPSRRAKKVLGLSERPFVLFVGRIDAVKGIDVLIEAIHRICRHPQDGDRDLGLIIIGGELDADPRSENREMKRLRQTVARLGLDERVAFWGAQRQDLLPYFYSAAEALVLPSRYESFGMVILEAMACGTPVIASRVGGIRTTVEDGRNGFLVPDGDARLLAERIRELIHDPSLEKRMVRAAKSRAAQFAWPKIARKVLRVYESVKGKREIEEIRSAGRRR